MCNIEMIPSEKTFIEWAEFAHDEIPNNALKIKVEYDENNIDIRCFKFIDENNENKDFMEKFKNKVQG